MRIQDACVCARVTHFNLNFMLSLYLSIALGGAVGSVSRFALSGLMLGRFGPAFPWGTLTVNILGSFLIGLLFFAVTPDGKFDLSLNVRQLFIAGFCGGFTTFSTFSLEALGHIRDGDVGKAALYAIASVLLCVAAVWAGYAAAMFINRQVG